MKVKLFVLLLVISFYFAACTAASKPAADKLPPCITEMISNFKNAAPSNPPRSVTEYEWEGRKVYYITSPCCDQFNYVYDEDCKVLGAPDGGITGKGDGKVPGFRQNAKEVKLVWKDDR